MNWSYILGNQTSAAAPIRLLSNRLICPDTCQSECASPTVETRGLTDAKAMLSPEKDTVHGHCWSSSHCQSSEFVCPLLARYESVDFFYSQFCCQSALLRALIVVLPVI